MNAGDRVTHPAWGAGVVDWASDRGMSVALDDGGIIGCNAFALANWSLVATVTGAR